MITRRRFLEASLASSSLVSLSGVAPRILYSAANQMATNDERVLVIVQLSGGNDGLNTVIPYGDDAYYRNRFTLAIPRNEINRIDDHTGFHPALSGFSKLLESGSLNVIQNVGYPNPNRSHFQSMDLWHTAHRQQENGSTGWLGRYVGERLAGASIPALHLGREDQPLALAARSVAVPSIRSQESFRLQAIGDGSLQQSLDSLIDDRSAGGPPEQDDLLRFIQQSTRTAIEASEKLDSIDRDAKTSIRYPETALALKLRTIGNLIGSGLRTRIYYVVIDGFDTHSNQGPAHQALLRELGDALAVFMDHLQDQGNHERVCVMTFSEFGRRVRENASRGTDHGTAAPMFVLGHGIKPGLTGNPPDFNNLDDGDLRYAIDYRQVYASILENWLGTPSQPILGGQFKTLELFTT